MRRVAEDPGRLDLVGAPEGFDALALSDILKARKGLAVFVAYVRAAAKAAGATNDFRGPMAKQQRMFLVTVVAAYMGFLPDDWTAATWRGMAAPSIALLIVCVGCVITAIRRIVRASGILRGRGTR